MPSSLTLNRESTQKRSNAVMSMVEPVYYQIQKGEIVLRKGEREQVERDYPGQVMEVELDRENGEWVYEVKLLRKGGALMKLKILARDGTILDFKEKNDKPHRQGEPR